MKGASRVINPREKWEVLQQIWYLGKNRKDKKSEGFLQTVATTFWWTVSACMDR